MESPRSIGEILSQTRKIEENNFNCIKGGACTLWKIISI